MIIKFETCTDFRKSLEARLKNTARKTGEDLQRLLRKVAFDRFLARLFLEEGSEFVLKGGYAMELHLSNARATKDIDLTCLTRMHQEQSSDWVLENLREKAAIQLGDYFTFHVGEAKIDLANAPYGGSRYPVAAHLDDRLFVRFQIDVGLDTLVKEVEMIQTTDWLEFSAIPPPHVPMITIEQQLAEKIHAYTFPYAGRINMRAKDLVDMVLLLQIRTLDPSLLQSSLKKVFRTRDSHPLPPQLSPPPNEWTTMYSNQAAECGISLTLSQAFAKVNQWFLALPKETKVNSRS